MRGPIEPLLEPLSIHEEPGQGMVEYSLIIGFVALVVFAALSLLGPKVANAFNNLNNSIAY